MSPSIVSSDVRSSRNATAETAAPAIGLTVVPSSPPVARAISVVAEPTMTRADVVRVKPLAEVHEQVELRATG